MRFLLWTAAVWSFMFLGIVVVDVAHTVSTGTVASQAVVQQIDLTPDGTGLLNWMGCLSRELDQAGHQTFGRVTPLVELFLYGLVSPLLIAMPLGWEASRRKWPRGWAWGIGFLSSALIALWALSKPGFSEIYYTLINALLLCCRVAGLSYYQGSLVYFILFPLAVMTGYTCALLCLSRTVRG